MAGSKHSKRGKQAYKVLGASAAILVVAGSVGIPFDIVAAVILGATLVLIVNPE
jgi:hypothetical protein